MAAVENKLWAGAGGSTSSGFLTWVRTSSCCLLCGICFKLIAASWRHDLSVCMMVGSGKLPLFEGCIKTLGGMSTFGRSLEGTSKPGLRDPFFLVDLGKFVAAAASGRRFCLGKDGLLLTRIFQMAFIASWRKPPCSSTHCFFDPAGMESCWLSRRVELPSSGARPDCN